MLGSSLAKQISEKGKGFGPSALSRKTGIHNETILKILSGNTENPGIYTVAKLADALHCSLDDLLDRQKYSHTEVKNKTHTQYKEALLKETSDFVMNFAATSGEKYDFIDIIHTVSEIYLYATTNHLDNVDTKFAEWFCNSYLLSRKILHSSKSTIR